MRILKWLRGLCHVFNKELSREETKTESYAEGHLLRYERERKIHHLIEKSQLAYYMAMCKELCYNFGVK